MPKTSIVRVALLLPVYRLFDYVFPAGIKDIPLQGCRVRVPFGRKELIGCIISVESESDFPFEKLKPVIELLDVKPVLSTHILQLLTWAAGYYHHPLGDIVLSALPKRLKEGAPAAMKCESHWCLTAEGRLTDGSALKNAPKQVALLHYLQKQPQAEWLASQLNVDWMNWRSPLKGLINKALVEVSEKVPVFNCATTLPTDGSDLAGMVNLNEQQLKAATAVVASLSSYKAFLLQGITGSGKTEVYLHAIEQALGQNRQILVLVPEISLTPQLLRRFMQRLNVPVASMHSGLNDTQRLSAWLQASSGFARVVIGTRSALFTPMPDLGLIILDEEHDASFKQQEGFRYHARDLALVRAKSLKIPVLLGSATPALESLENVARGQFELLRLTRRAAAGAKPPQVSLLDVCRRPMDDGISDILYKKIEQHLKDEGQVLLFLNRRGYAPMMMCHECGWTTACQRCDANMTLHQHNRRLRCHHCGYEKAAPAVCPECGQDSLYIPGAGTERIEIALNTRFPSVVISRIDKDTTRRKGALEDKLDQARRGEARILIGTQMLAKGHDFPGVTLVGILNTDQGLFSADFRGTEHMAQLIIQVSGRAGRGQRRGEVVIQTHHPEHPLLHVLLESGYPGFAKIALEERRQAGFPPYSYMMMIRCESVQKESGVEFLNECRQKLDYQGIEIFGPLAAPMERRAGRYRWQLVVLSKDRKKLHGALHHWVPEITRLKSVNKVRWSIDVDPQDMF